jgi:hypothetical protein
MTGREMQAQAEARDQRIAETRQALVAQGFGDEWIEVQRDADHITKVLPVPGGWLVLVSDCQPIFVPREAP